MSLAICNNTILITTADERDYISIMKSNYMFLHTMNLLNIAFSRFSQKSKQSSLLLDIQNLDLASNSKVLKLIEIEINVEH